MRPSIEALLVEDNLSDAQLFTALVNSADSIRPKLHYAERFQTALKELKGHSFDIVLLDLCLPDGQGMDLVKQIKELIPNLPIIILTGLQDETMAISALQQGVQDYLVKSEMFSPSRLARLGYVDIGNLLVERLRYAVERADLTKQLEISQERYALAVEGAHDGIWDWDLRTQEIYYSPRCRHLLGLPNYPSSQGPDTWFTRIHKEDREYFELTLQKHLSRCESQFSCEYRVLQKDGCYRWLLTRGMALWDEDGIAYRVAGSQTDITSHKKLEQDLFQEKELAQITLHSIGDAVITTDAQGRIKDFNPVAEKLTGWQAQDAKQKLISQVVKIIDGNTRECLRNPAIEAIQHGAKVSLSNHPTLISKTGEEFAIGDSAAPIRSDNGRVMGAVLVFHDVTEERGRSQQLAWQASHDQLTRLFNRKAFVQSLEDAIMESRFKESHHVLCCMDLDHFKIVNDTCGHLAGDKLLQQVADLWRHKIRKSDVLARLGGDEFGLLLYDCNLPRALKIASFLCNSIQSSRFFYEGRFFNLSVSVGIVVITSDIQNVEEALRLADTACYTAKDKGRNRVQVYHPNDDSIAQKSSDSQWFSRINQALETHQFMLYSQSITVADASTNCDEMCEILLRLPDVQPGKITLPVAFIPPAERYGLMPTLDRWVIQRVLNFLAGHPPSVTKIYSVNLSGSSLNDDSFIAFLKQQLEQYPIDPKMLCFEITETVAIANLQKVAKFILELKKLGCHFALDDFGSGMSSFSYLRHLPVDYLKIDGNLVKEAASDSVTCSIVKAIHQIGHLMGLKTIAEYVEDQVILDNVQKIGIDYAQGYAIDYPKPLLSA